MSGLIDQLSRGWSDELGWCCDLDDLRDLLRSDETREAIAEAIWHTHAPNIPLGEDYDLRNLLLAEADAVQRVLTGEAGR